MYNSPSLFAEVTKAVFREVPGGQMHGRRAERNARAGFWKDVLGAVLRMGPAGAEIVNFPKRTNPREPLRTRNPVRINSISSDSFALLAPAEFRPRTVEDLYIVVQLHRKGRVLRLNLDTATLPYRRQVVHFVSGSIAVTGGKLIHRGSGWLEVQPTAESFEIPPLLRGTPQRVRVEDYGNIGDVASLLRQGKAIRVELVVHSLQYQRDLRDELAGAAFTAGLEMRRAGRQEYIISLPTNPPSPEGGSDVGYKAQRRHLG